MTRRSNDTIKLEFVINGDKARKEIASLDRESMKLREQIKGMKEGTTEYVNTSQRISEVNNRKKELRKTIGLTSMTMRELNAESKRLSSIKAHLTPGTQQFREVDARLASVNQRMTTLRNGAKATGVSLKSMAAGFNRYFSMVTAMVASFVGLVMGARKAVQAFNDFRQTVAGLSALTGLMGDELEWLSDKAIEMSTNVVEGNIRITQSAQDIVNAYMVMGSQRPELLKNQQALQAVTQDAIILSEAAKMELEPAIKAVSMTLNQFERDASDSRDIINALAAGSQAGAGNIPYLTGAIEHAGTTMNLMNLSFQEGIALIETLAPFYSQASQAGNTLDKTLLIMMRHNIGYKNGVFDINTALDELEDRFKKGERSIDIFGARHAKAATLLVQNRSAFENFTVAVTGTNKAIEQATINTETNAAALEQARNRYARNLMELGRLLAPVITFSTNFFSYLMKFVLNVVKEWEKYREVLIALIATYAAYNIIAIRRSVIDTYNLVLTRAIAAAEITAAAATKAYQMSILLLSAAKHTLTGNIVKASAAMQAFRVLAASTPWGAILAGVTAVASALIIYNRRQNRLTESQLAYKRVSEEVNKQFDTEAATIIRLKSIIENVNIPLWKRIEATEQLNEILPEYNGYLDEEGKLHKHSADMIDNYLDKLKQKILMNVLENEMTELIEKRRDVLREAEKAEDDYTESKILSAEASKQVGVTFGTDSRHLQGFTQNVNRSKKALDEKTDAVSNVDEAIDLLHDEYQKLLESMDDFGKTTRDTTEDLDDLQETLNDGAAVVDLLGEKIKATEEALGNLSIRMNNLIFTEQYEQAALLNKELGEMKILLDSLNAQQVVVSLIAESGGDVNAFLDSITDDTLDLIDEQNAINETYIELFPPPEHTRDRLQENLDAIAEFNSMRQMADEEYYRWVEQQEKERMAKMKDLFIGIGFEMTSAASQIYSDRLRDQTDKEVTFLNQSMERQLSNENLTEDQKDTIRENYRRKEAQIKQRAFRREKTAKLIESFINTALAITEALPDPFRVAWAAAAGAMQSGVIAAQPVPQYKEGSYKYLVKGKDDNKTYSATWIGTPKTGLYSKPVLVSETGGEIIIDPATTKNIVANYPEILSSIEHAKVKQYATGTPLPSASDNSSSSNEFSDESFQSFLAASLLFKDAIDKMVDNGVNANIYMTQFAKEFNKYNDTVNSAKPR